MREERRNGSRHPIRVDVVLDDDARFHAGATLDLSEAGALIESAVPMNVGTSVRLIPLIDTKRPLLELRGRVVRSSLQRGGGHTVAVELDLSNRERAAYEEIFESVSWSVRAASF